MAWIKENLEGLTSLVTAIVAALGIFLSYMTIRIAKQESKAKNEDARRERFSRAIEYLKDESLAIRMGALFELKKIGLESPADQEMIIRIITPYARDRIEKRQYLSPSRYSENLQRPGRDVFLACEIISLFHKKCKVDISYLKAKGLNLYKILLHGFYLRHVDFCESKLELAELPSADLGKANLTGTYLLNANLRGANLQGAIGLTAEQLLDAYIDDTTLLDPDLRAEYDRLKAEQGE